MSDDGPALRRFTNKGRQFIHVENGWCVRQVSAGGRPGWRVYYGVLVPGKAHPDYVTVYEEFGLPVQFPDREAAVKYVLDRRAI